MNRILLALALGLLIAPLPISAADPPADEFFEKDIRPLLANHCYRCHGAMKQSGGLRLDSRASALQGGDSGPAFEPGHPDKSLLISAVRREGDRQMPPETALTQRQIESLVQWVKLGAAWPASQTSDAVANGNQPHWAFLPLTDPAVPGDDRGQGSAVDAFVQSRLEQAGLSSSPPADPRTLIRRATFDLTGLPPTPEEVEAFVQAALRDPHSAYEELIDRLLASPQYGEQWGRHWLDVARYSDTKGYVYAREERFWIHAWAYRDWVVRSLNEDLPYDRFLLLQLAADQVTDDDPASLAAMGFLTLGRRFLGVTQDIIDDRIDVVTRGTMGLTVACARCHDHKYDPIPTRDYYSLYGIFANCRERVLPIAEPAVGDKAFEAFDKGLRERQQKLDDALAKARSEWTTRTRARTADYLFAQFELQKYPEDTFNQVFSKDDILPAYVRQWQAYLVEAQQRGDPVFTPWHAYAAIPPAEFSQRADEITRSLASRSDAEVNPLVAEKFTTAPSRMLEVCQRYGELFADIDKQWQAALKEAADASQPAPKALTDAAAEALRQVLYGPRAPCEPPSEPIVHTENHFDLAACEAIWKLQGEVDRWLIRTPAATPHAVILEDRSVTTPARVFRRGNPQQKGEIVPPQFLEILAGPQRKPFEHGSGRLELAKAIIDPRNPLTARVMVNRVWQQHFGAGLVRTPSDFGKRAETPSHPELLDWLASRFIEDGWRLKPLHRRIMLSAAYRQSSFGPADAELQAKSRQLDPENRLLWRMNPHRLSFEELRDAALAAAGRLDLMTGGRPSDLFNASFRRRTLYGLVDRQFLPSTLRVFDFANPDLHIPQRSETTAPQQALFFLNHSLLVQQAQALAQRTESAATTQQRIGMMYQLAYQREPTADQTAAALALIESSQEDPAASVPATVAAWSYGYGEYDETAKQLRGFTPLPHFTGKAWQGGANWPDAKLGWVQLTAEGGHAGNDRQHAAVRRWTAPAEMNIRIESVLTHATKAGDGIRGFLVHSREGLLASAAAHDSQVRMDMQQLAVRAGDTLDFVVDIGEGLNNDQFTWQIELTQFNADPRATTVWNAKRDFHGPPVTRLSPWEQLAQVLLSANEFLFVD